METLNVNIDDFVRVAFVSSQFQSSLGAAIHRASQVFIACERLMVAANVKPACIQVVDSDELLATVDWASNNGLVVRPIEKVAKTDSYSARRGPIRGAWQYRVLIAPFEQVQKYGKISDGELLGYPECCREFFRRVWVDENNMDTTYHMFINTDQKADKSRFWLNSMFLRWIGIRAVSHLPCAYSCTESQKHAEVTLDFMKARFPDEAFTITELLKMPTTWTSLHGIATITTPAFKIVTNTDAYAEKIVVSNVDQLSQLHRDNGFNNPHEMHRAHKLVLTAIRDLDFGLRRVIDLGCGNGELLRKVYELFHCRTLGVEKEVAVVSRAYPGAQTRCVTIQQFFRVYCPAADDLLLISSNRLREDVVTREAILNVISKDIPVLIYSYDNQHVSFPELDLLASNRYSYYIVDTPYHVRLYWRTYEQAGMQNDSPIRRDFSGTSVDDIQAGRAGSNV